MGKAARSSATLGRFHWPRLKGSMMVILSLGLLTGVGVVVIQAQAASATTWTVTNCNDSGSGSLRHAVSSAASGDTVRFALSPTCPTITLTSGTIDINVNLTITGPGATMLAVSGGGASGVFLVSSGVTASISGLTVENGNAGAASGGGIDNEGTLTVSQSTISDNNAPATYAGGGGGVANSGTLTVSQSTIQGNSAYGNGGGIYNQFGGTLSVSQSTISDNTADDGDGGGIDNDGTATVSNSTLSGNGTGYLGGGISNDLGTLTVANSTLADNSAFASGWGGGIYNCGSGPGLCGLVSPPATSNLQATILANNTGGACGGPITDNGYNIDDDGTCGFTAPSISNSPTLDGSLAPIADNGGFTWTIALFPTSPAIDQVPTPDCPATDQRGVARTAPCDIGAYDTDPGGPSGLDHFTCYTATSPRSTTGFQIPSSVSLINQFAPSGFTVDMGLVADHCNPVQKTVGTTITPIINPNTHLLCLNFKALTKQASQTVSVSNQFGTATLVTKQPNILCLPSWKSLTGPPAEAQVQPPGLDDYTCYAAAYAPSNKTTRTTPPRFSLPTSVGLLDQFMTSPGVTAKLSAPNMLCLPTEQASSLIKPAPMVNPTAHLVCFPITYTPTVSSMTVYDQNQLGTGTVTTNLLNELCVPSSKEILGSTGQVINTGQIVVTAVDPNDISLIGATFTAYAATDTSMTTPLGSCTTQSTGTCSIALSPGQYIVSDTSAASGYTTDTAAPSVVTVTQGLDSVVQRQEGCTCSASLPIACCK